MVPANDEQEPEPTAPQITAGNKPPTATVNSSPHLTSMPPWLMHWWTPLLLAGILLAAGCFLASIWRMPLRSVSWLFAFEGVGVVGGVGRVVAG